MFDTTDASAPTATANEVVTAEVKVAQNHDSKLTPAAEKLAKELYKNLSMGCDAYMDMLPRVEDNRIKTDITAAMCYYEKPSARSSSICWTTALSPRSGA